ncbi:response regulator [Paenibacillus sp. FSL W8-1187]|uniref:DNA-binding response regulator, AraC family n=1 Tax=Paenibacillus pasadenensis TaxID=217090 RepID=A0A2N5N8L5_9BACL|nr:response regulator [Paenibacillus pasadenensis]PLT46696.1 DNA-binding response regulator, AraC family [Paenibacillus pasadenensis]
MQPCRVLLVDDEFIILDGIASVIPWERHGTVLAGTAQNGIAALELMESVRPDILITDIRMPGMDGLELAERVSEAYPDVGIIMLTGFNEFEYAKSAMQHGVKHYLLKPCSSEDVTAALDEIVAAQRERDSGRRFLESVKHNLAQALPYAREQFLRELVSNKRYGEREWTRGREMFGLQQNVGSIRLLLFEADGDPEYEQLFAMKNIAEELLPGCLLSALSGSYAMLLLEDGDEDELYRGIDLVREAYLRYYRLDATAALSEAGPPEQARRLYLQALSCLGYRFYLGEGGLITPQDVMEPLAETGTRGEFDMQRLLMLIQAGNEAESRKELDRLMEELAAWRLDVPEAKSYLIQLFMELSRLYGREEMDRSLERLSELIATGSIRPLQGLLEQMRREIAGQRAEQTRRRHSRMVESVKAIVERSYADESLSLSSAAKEMFMNPDYVGKRFKLETGERFTQHVLRYRIQKAIERMEQDAGMTVAQLAEETGFGFNASYFSKMFKKMTGVSPTEYRGSR